MARSSNQQFDFRAGEWSPLSLGRANDPRYMSAMSLCRNSIIAEEGAVVRRPGTQRLGPTKGRQFAHMLKFISSTNCAFGVEATGGTFRFWDNAKPVFTNDAKTVSTSSASTFTGFVTLGLSGAHGWSVGDTVMAVFPQGYSPGNEAACRGRYFTLQSGSTGSTLVLGDDLGNGFPLSFINAWITNTSLVGTTICRIKEVTNTYNANDVPNLRLVQAQTQGIILSSREAPNALQVTETTGQDPVFTYGALTLVDGPYLDPSGDTCTVSGFSGSITVHSSTTTPFASTDVGRQIRLFSEPPAWNAATAYTTGNTVTDAQGEWWQALINSTGVTPGTTTTISGVTGVAAWAPAPTAGRWAWGTITAFTDSSHVTVLLDTTVPNMGLISANGSTCTMFQLGVFNSAVGFPTCGTYYEGRLYFFGAVPNRLDASVANGFNQPGLAANSWQMSPTDPYDNVLDDSGISEELNSTDINTVYSAQPDAQGIVVFTNGGEWLVSASTLGDPITPSSIQAHRVTRYRAEPIDPAVTPMSLVFPQSYGRRIIEYLSDAFTQRYTGKPLNEDARHMAISGVNRIDYQSEPTPIIWATMNDGTLAGCTYRRVSRFVTENPAIYAWHSHYHGSPQGKLYDIAVLPAQAGSSGDVVYVLVQDGSYGSFVELLTLCREVEPLQSILDGWFVDSSPGGGQNPGLTCGSLVSSIPGTYGGVSGTGTVTTWNNPGPSLPTPDLPAPGTVIPAAPSPNFNGFRVLEDAPYFNGSSCFFNTSYQNVTGLAAAEFTISVWLWMEDFTQGSIFSNDWTNFLPPGSPNGDYVFLAPPVNIGDEQVVFHGSVNSVGLASSPGISGFAKQWVNVLFASSAINNAVHLYVNDTKINQALFPLFASDLWNFGNWCFGGINPWPNVPDPVPQYVPVVNKKVEVPAYVPLLPQWNNATVRGTGVRQSTWTYWYPISPAPPAPGSPQFVLPGPPSPYNPDANGLSAGVAELWFDKNFIDIDVLANRRKFNCTDVANLRYAPVALGDKGQTPTGSPPVGYFSGNRDQFRYNRAANNLKVVTVNNAPATGEIALDPNLVMLDPLPPYIEAPT